MGDSSFGFWASFANLASTGVSLCVAVIAWRSRRRVVRVAGGSWLILFALATALSPLTALLFSFIVCPLSGLLGIWLILVPRRGRSRP